MVDRQSQIQSEIELINRNLETGRISKGRNVRAAKARLGRLKEQLQDMNIPRERQKERDLFLTAAQARLTSRAKFQNIKQQRTALNKLQRETGLRVTVPSKRVIGDLGFRVQRRKKAANFRDELQNYIGAQNVNLFLQAVNKKEREKFERQFAQAVREETRRRIIDKALAEVKRVREKAKDISTLAPFKERIKRLESQNQRNLPFFKKKELLLQKIETYSQNKAAELSGKIDNVDAFTKKVLGNLTGSALNFIASPVLRSPELALQTLNALSRFERTTAYTANEIFRGNTGKALKELQKQNRAGVTSAKTALSQALRDPATYIYPLFALGAVAGKRFKFTSRPTVELRLTAVKSVKAGDRIGPNRLVFDQNTKRAYVSGENGVAVFAGKYKSLPRKTKSQIQRATNQVYTALQNKIARKTILKDARAGSQTARALQEGIQRKRLTQKQKAQQKREAKLDLEAFRKSERVFNRLVDTIVSENKSIKNFRRKYKQFLKGQDSKTVRTADKLFKQLTDKVIKENKRLKLQKSKIRKLLNRKITPALKKALQKLITEYNKIVSTLQKNIKALQSKITQLSKSIKGLSAKAKTLALKPLKLAISRLKGQIFEYQQQIRLIKARISDKLAPIRAKRSLKKATKQAKKLEKQERLAQAKKQGFSGLREKQAYEKAFNNVEKRQQAGLPPLKKDLKVLQKIEKNLRKRSNKRLKKSAKLEAKQQKKQAKLKAKQVKSLLAKVKRVGIVTKKTRKLSKSKRRASIIRGKTSKSKKVKVIKPVKGQVDAFVQLKQGISPSQAFNTIKKNTPEAILIDNGKRAVIINPRTSEAFVFKQGGKKLTSGRQQLVQKTWTVTKKKLGRAGATSKPQTQLLKGKTTKAKKVNKTRKAFTKTNQALRGKSRIRASPSFFLALGRAFKAIGSQKTNLTPAQRIVLDQNIKILQNVVNKQIPSIKQPQDIINALASGQVSGQKISQNVKISSQSSLQSILKSNLAQKTKPRRKVEKKAPPKRRLLPPPLEKQKKTKFNPNKPYNVYVRRGNKYVKFNPKPLKGSDAKRVLRWAVNNNIAGSGTLRPTKGKTIKIAKRINAPAKYFRKPKKGSRLPPLSLVEKRFFRLNTVGEKRQISLAKLRKQAFGKKKRKTKKRATRRKKRR